MFLMSGPHIIAPSDHRMERAISPLSRMAALLLVLLGVAPILAPVRVWPQAWGSPSYSAAPTPKRQTRLQADVNDCSRWATAETGFNPGSNKLPPSWDQPKAPSTSARARYNHWMGSCLGQRESRDK